MVPKQNGGDSARQRQSEGCTSPTRMERQAAGPEWDWMSGAFAMPCLESGKLEDNSSHSQDPVPSCGVPTEAAGCPDTGVIPRPAL